MVVQKLLSLANEQGVYTLVFPHTSLVKNRNQTRHPFQALTIRHPQADMMQISA